MRNKRRGSEFPPGYYRMTDEQKVTEAKKILSNAPSDPRQWNDETCGVAHILAQLSVARRDYIAVSTCSDGLLSCYIAQYGVGNEANVLPAAYNAGLAHWRLEDTLGVISVTKSVYDYWVSEQIPTARSLRRLAKMVRLYTCSVRPREASRLNKRVLVGSLRHGRFLRFVRSLVFQTVIGLGLYGLAGNPQLEGRMKRRPKGTR
jgi:hypothetical protein